MILRGVGLAIGLAGAVALTTAITSVLCEVKATDPTTYLSVLSFLLLASLLACYLPARRATRIDPITALRYD